MKSIEPRSFLEQWQKVELPDARFGLLNGLETGTLSVWNWNYIPTFGGTREYVGFLISVVKEKEPDGRCGTKALQVLLKFLKDCQWSPDLDYPFQEVIKELAEVRLGESFLREPLVRMIREFLEQYFKSIHGYIGLSTLNLDLSSWYRAAILTDNGDLTHRVFTINEEDIRKKEVNRAIKELLWVFREQMQLAENLMGRPVVPSEVMGFSHHKLPVQIYAKELLLLMARRGDFNELISLA